LTPIREQSEASGPQLVIWGTDVVVSMCKSKFRRFINQFLPSDEENLNENLDISEPFYLQELQQVTNTI
jgi:DNA replication licensing factor MCM4